jgi:hypothetical protein
MVNVESEGSALAVKLGGYPCTVARCACADFVMSALNSIVCATCGHSDQDHGLP